MDRGMSFVEAKTILARIRGKISVAEIYEVEDALWIYLNDEKFNAVFLSAVMPNYNYLVHRLNFHK